MLVIAYNIDNIGIKAMVKKTAKQTGHTLLEDYKSLIILRGKIQEEEQVQTWKGRKMSRKRDQRRMEQRRKISDGGAMCIAYTKAYRWMEAVKYANVVILTG